MDVRFLRGLSTAYAAIASKDSKTFYFTTDDNKLYLGNVCLSNQDVEARVKVIEDHGYVNGGEVDAKISAAIANYYTKGEIDTLIAGLSVGAIDGRVSTLEGKVEAIEAWDSKDITADDIAAWNAEKGAKAKFDDYRTKAAQDEIDNAQTKALNDYKAEMVETLKGYQTTIPANTYDAYGSAATAEQNAKQHADDAIDNLIKTYLDGETDEVINTLEEVAAWINNDTAGVTKIIEDVASNKTNIATNAADLDKVEAKLNGIAEGDGTVKAAIDAVDAKFADYTKTNDLGDLALKDSLTAGEVGAYTKGEVDSAIATATTDMATNGSVDGKLVSYRKAADQDVIDAGKADKATYEAYVEAHKDDYNNAKVDELVAAAQSAAEGKAATAQAAAEAAQGEVDALEGVVAENAQTCQNNFNTISNQLTWGSF